MKYIKLILAGLIISSFAIGGNLIASANDNKNESIEITESDAALQNLQKAKSKVANTYYEQLCQFNFNWLKYSDKAPKGEARVFNSDAALVQAHLTSVVEVLKSNSVSDLSKAQRKTRKQLIKTLANYAAAGNFPQNYYSEKRLPVFVDEHQTHCAVGYLLQQSGYEELAAKIAKTDNYVWVKDIKDKDVLAWQAQSGLSLEELKLVQGVYDFYLPNALTLPNKHEVPQKPAVMTEYFDDKKDGKKIWCKGEGKNGVLNGQWTQNFSTEFPWIVGYYENNNRTGQWREYYQGTNKLCRTENWRDDELNGVRTRFNRAGKIVEEIMFKDGEAITKTNFDLDKELKWVRKPLDNDLIYTEVFTFGGAPIASGHEKVNNRGNLHWFQDIELTALNSMAITSKSLSTNSNSFNLPVGLRQSSSQRLFSNPPLVEYKKEGVWTYYREHALANNNFKPAAGQDLIVHDYKHFGQELATAIAEYKNLEIGKGFNSIKAKYNDNKVVDFYGNGDSDTTHIHISYQPAVINFNGLNETFYIEALPNQSSAMPRIRAQGLYYPQIVSSQSTTTVVKEIGQHNALNQKIGVWRYFNANSELSKVEHYIKPEPIAISLLD